MKKILLSLILAGGLLTSCDMDVKPVGSIVDSNAVVSMNDCYRLRNGIYSSLRSVNTGGYVYFTEMQMDKFQGIQINGNRIGNIANGSILSSDGDIESVFSGLYSRIANVNFFLEESAKFAENAELTDDQQIELNRYIGEAKFARAFYNFYLFDHFCETYSEDKANIEGKGIQLVTKYAPTADESTYPGRSTMAETLKMISDDLTDAYNDLVAYEQKNAEYCAPNAIYLSSYAVMALQARVALVTGDYQTAIDKAEAVIISGKYQLATGDDYVNMWINDTSSEVIFLPFSSANELGISSMGAAWISMYADRADYIPSFEALAAYEQGDVRFDAFIGQRNLTVDGAKYPAYTFNKFPGNPALQPTADINLMNRPKVFRASELYLIIAEAAAEKGIMDKANNALRDLREARIENYEHSDLAGANLIAAVRDERAKELIGEGFRMSDLRRWKQAFRRDPSHPENPNVENILTVAGKNVAYTADDHRYVWPIPSSEMEVNPQLAGQQNPGY